MEEINWKEKAEENKKLLDGLELPKPRRGEDLRDYCDRLGEIFSDLELPEDYHDDLIYWLDMEEFGEYLAKRFGMRCVEDVIITWTMY